MKVFACRCYLRDTAFPWLQIAVYACDFNSAVVRAVERCRSLLNYEGQIYSVTACEVPSPTLSDIHGASQSFAGWRPFQDGQRMFPREELQLAFEEEHGITRDSASLALGTGRDGVAQAPHSAASEPCAL